MRSSTNYSAAIFPLFTTVMVALVCASGCVNSLKGTIPAQCLPPEILGPSRDDLVPIDFTLLAQKRPPAHIIGPEDILGIYIEGMLGETPQMRPAAHFPGTYGPTASGNFTSPAVGSPITVRPDGTIALPLVPPIHVSGLTLMDAEEQIRRAYTGKSQLLQPGREVISVTLMKPRLVQVLVLREDSIMNWPILKSQGSTLVVTRGNASALDLPIYQNDVLHALTLTGGLPGSDATNDIWVLHGVKPDQWEVVNAAVNSLRLNPPKAASQNAPGPLRIVRIPLKVLAGEPLEFTPADMLLEPGDVLFVPSRGAEQFYAGGMLPGQQLWLPRDYELDILGAIAIAGGSAAGPPGWNSQPTLFSSNRGPGSILPPTRVIILRKVPGGEQVRIYVNLKKCLYDRKERIPIRPGDVILLQYTPSELFANYFLNLINFNAAITKNFGSNGGPVFSQ